MALDLTINPEYKDQKVSHGDVCGKKVSEHSQDELIDLAIHARMAAHQPNALSRCFKNLPSLADLQSAKVDAGQSKVSVPVAGKK